MWEKNQLKEKLENEKLAVGSCIYSSSPALVELMGYCNLDFCRIDNEHSWRKDESVENMVRAAAISGIVPLLRIDFDKDVIRKALEIGAGGIQPLLGQAFHRFHERYQGKHHNQMD